MNYKSECVKRPRFKSCSLFDGGDPISKLYKDGTDSFNCLKRFSFKVNGSKDILTLPKVTRSSSRKRQELEFTKLKAAKHMSLRGSNEAKKRIRFKANSLIKGKETLLSRANKNVRNKTTLENYSIVDKCNSNISQIKSKNMVFIKRSSFNNKTRLRSISSSIKDESKVKKEFNEDNHWVTIVAGNNRSKQLKCSITKLLNKYKLKETKKENKMYGEYVCRELLEMCSYSFANTESPYNKLYTLKDINSYQNAIEVTDIRSIDKSSKYLIVTQEDINNLQRDRIQLDANKDSSPPRISNCNGGVRNKSVMVEKSVIVGIIKKRLDLLKKKYEFGIKVYYELFAFYMSLIAYNKGHTNCLNVSKAKFIEATEFFRKRDPEFIKRVLESAKISKYYDIISLDDCVTLYILFKYFLAKKERYISFWVNYFAIDGKTVIRQKEYYQLLTKLVWRLTLDDDIVEDNVNAIKDILENNDCIDSFNRLHIDKLKACLENDEISIDIFNDQMRI